MHQAHCSTALPLTGLLVRDGFKHRLRHLLDFKKSAVAAEACAKREKHNEPDRALLISAGRRPALHSIGEHTRVLNRMRW